MARVGANQVVSFPARSLAPETMESLRARFKAIEDAAAAARAEALRARAELLRVRETCQQMLDASALDVLQLTRDLQARDRVAAVPVSVCDSRATAQSAVRGADDDIPFDVIEAALAASPLCSEVG